MQEDSPRLLMGYVASSAAPPPQRANSTGTSFGPGRLRLELDAENNFGDLPQGDFVQRLWQLKTVYAFSPDLIVSAFGQYDSESRDLGINTRLRWTIQPGRDLFVVWNRNWQRALDPGYRLGLDSDQVVVKLRWTTLW